MNSIFVSAEMTDFSFWRPSLGPTSTILTNDEVRAADVVYGREGVSQTVP